MASPQPGPGARAGAAISTAALTVTGAGLAGAWCVRPTLRRTLSPQKGLCSPPDTVLLPPGPRHSSGEESQAGTIPLSLYRAPFLPSAPLPAGSARSGSLPRSLRTAPHPARVLPRPLLWDHSERRGGYEPRAPHRNGLRLPPRDFLKQIKGCHVSPSARLPAPGAAAGETAAASLPRCLLRAFGKYLFKKRKKKKKRQPHKWILVNGVVGAGLGGGGGTMALLN